MPAYLNKILKMQETSEGQVIETLAEHWNIPLYVRRGTSQGNTMLSQL